MKKIPLSFVAIAMIAACLFTASKPAFADTYQIFPLQIDAEIFFYSMDDSGDVALFNPVGGPNYPTFFTYHYGVPTANNTPIVPTWVDDQGTPCTPTVPPGGFVLHGVCNNGRDAFTGALSSGQLFPGLYTGSDPNITLIVPRFEGLGPYMNSNGDIVADDVYTEEWYYFQDTSVPEPGSILLFGTGAVSLLGAIRCRFQAS